MRIKTELHYKGMECEIEAEVENVDGLRDLLDQLAEIAGSSESPDFSDLLESGSTEPPPSL
jgi:hypothetical protein